ncbi:MAG: sugar ABC transporter ATP-binding protein [Eubacteriales bacterium]|nr:sugar ABC transporter ATP-binding protein [Eubacteriales bacterium]
MNSSIDIKTENGQAETALELRNITKLYAGTVALDNVSLTVRRGEVHGLIGKNGAGKSTLVGVISGLVIPSSGEILLDGQSYSSLSPITAKRHHVSIVTQEPQVVEESTVAENFFMPLYDGGSGFIDWKALNKKAADILSNAGFPLDPQMKMSDLSISERQLLLVIKACYVERAEVVIMDEVSASLGQRDQQILYGIIKDLTSAGKTIIFISHHTEELLKVCTCVTVIRDGRNVGSVDVAKLDKKSLAALIVGDTNYDDTAIEDRSYMIKDEEAFRLRDFTRAGKFRHISLSVKKGEILGLAGLRGSGRTELFKSVVGIDPYDEGEIYIDGVKKSFSSPAAAGRGGVAYLPEEREAEGLVSIASIQSNLSLGILNKLSNKLGIINQRQESGLADGLIKTLDIKTLSRKQEISQLSGGNKQKVLVGKIMAHAPHVCLLDEPTRGVDIEAKESILTSINKELRSDSCVVITSPGVEDLMKICDRILVIYEGEIISEFDKSEFSEQEIYRAMQGEEVLTYAFED